METYHKIQTVYLRDPDTNFKTLLEGQWAKPDFEYLKDLEWHWTEKVDGTNIRVQWDGFNVRFNGKTDNAQMHADLYRALEAMFPTEAMAAQFGNDNSDDGGDQIAVCLYGEGYGAGIQKGGGYRTDKSFILFDVNVNGTWLERPNVEDVATKLNIGIVPIVGKGTLTEAVEFAQTGYNSVCALNGCVAEGLVMRPATELFNRRGERVITKLKYKDFGMVQSAAR